MISVANVARNRVGKVVDDSITALFGCSQQQIMQLRMDKKESFVVFFFLPAWFVFLHVLILLIFCRVELFGWYVSYFAKKEEIEWFCVVLIDTKAQNITMKSNKNFVSVSFMINAKFFLFTLYILLMTPPPPLVKKKGGVIKSKS